VIVDRQRYALDTFARHAGQPGRFLEIGCAGGFLLQAMQRRGWKSCGLELSSQCVAFARKMKLKVIQKDLLEAKLKTGSFDAVLMGDVFEHIIDPVAFLKETHRIMEPGGVLLVKTPSFVNSGAFRILNLFSRLLRGLGVERKFKLLGLLKVPGHQQVPARPYHAYEYDAPCLRRMLERAGFQVLEVGRTVPLPDSILHPARLTPISLFQKYFFLTLSVAGKLFKLPIGSMIVTAKRI